MKLFNRVISILIVLSIFSFTAFSDTGFALPDNSGGETAGKVKYNEEACKFLISLGIIDDTFGFQYEKEISRMEFARVVLKAGGYSTEDFEPTGVFPDVTEENEYMADIELLYELGIVSGDGNLFAPARNVTYTEAIVMLLRAAGYTDLVNANGGYPNGYLQIARSEGLLKNVASAEKFTGDDMVVMVYNMLMLKTIGFSAPGKFEFDEDETILSKRHSVYYRKGIVCENGVTGLYSASTVKKDEVAIDTGAETVVMSVGNTDIDDMLGYRVSAYYKYDEYNDKSECVYYEYASKNSTLEIDIADIENVTPGKIEYSVGNKTSKVKTGAAAIIYNDAYYVGPALSMESFTGKIGKITFIDNNGDGDYDIISMDIYETYIVGNAVSKDEFIFDKETDEKVDLSSEDTDKYILVMSDGKDAVFGDICENTIISVAKSAPLSDVRTTKVIISVDRASGSLSGVYEDDGKRFVELDGINKYRLLERVSNASLPFVGNGVTLLLDAFGNAAYVETRFLAGDQYGFLVGTKRNTREDKVTVQLLTREGKIENISIADKSKIDGKTYRNPDAAYSYLSSIPKQAVDGGFMPEGVMPVLYRLSDTGEMRSLDTPQKGAEEDINSLTLLNSGRNVFSSSTFGYTIPVNSDTTVIEFTSPDKTAREYYDEAERYDFRGISAFRDKKVYTYNAYKIDPKSDYADLIVYFPSNSFDYDTELVVVKDYSEREFDEETEEVFLVFEGMSSGKVTRHPISKDYEDDFLELGLKAGDVVRCLYDEKDRLCDVDGPIFSYDSRSKAITVDNASDGTADATRVKSQETSAVFLIGDVSARKEGLIKLQHLVWGNTYTSNDTQTAISARESFYVKIEGSTPVTVFDVAECGDNMLYSGTYDDITAMNNSYSNHSIVVLRFRSSTLQEVVVINNIYR